MMLVKQKAHRSIKYSRAITPSFTEFSIVGFSFQVNRFYFEVSRGFEHARELEHTKQLDDAEEYGAAQHVRITKIIAERLSDVCASSRDCALEASGAVAKRMRVVERDHPERQNRDEINPEPAAEDERLVI